jgi:hypothetical protein
LVPVFVGTIHAFAPPETPMVGAPINTRVEPERYGHSTVGAGNDEEPAGDGLCNEDCDGLPDVPIGFSLGLALPNPTRGLTDVAYAVPWPGSHVSMKIFDLSGRHIATLVDEHKSPGRYSAGWDGKSPNGYRVAPGTYFVYMEGENFRESTKLLLLR